MRKCKGIVALSLAAGLLSAQVAHADATQANSGAKTGAQPPRDALSGQASGKRQHQPLTITKHVDSSSPAVVVKPSDSARAAKVKSHSNTNNN